MSVLTANIVRHKIMLPLNYENTAGRVPAADFALSSIRSLVACIVDASGEPIPVRHELPKLRLLALCKTVAGSAASTKT